MLVITRKNPPFRGQPGFPGALVSPGASPVDTLRREVKDETNLDEVVDRKLGRFDLTLRPRARLRVLDVVVNRKLGRFDAPGRDPRGRVIADVHLCRLVPGPRTIRCREDAGDAAFVDRADPHGEDLAFDHEDMLAALDSPRSPTP